MSDRIEELARENERLRRALIFYSDPARYQGPNCSPLPEDPYGPPDFGCRWDVTRDEGEIARAALAGKDAQ